ncbi:hypothetical protein AB4144_09450, partial [Rhizobiaceae sp. 2RAB30]
MANVSIASGGDVRRSMSSYTIPSIVLLALLVTMVVAPLVFLFRASLTPTGELPFSTDVYTLDNYVTALTSPNLATLVGNTLRYAFGSVIVGVSIAFGIAWMVERTDLPLKSV